ncbi:RNA polymerase sigma factor [Pseudochelatococcus sp. B33]
MKDGPERRVSLYLDQRAVLVAYASRMVGSRDIAEEVVQEAFIRFVPGSAGSSADQRPASYLFRIVHNLALDFLRRRKRENAGAAENAPSWTRPQAEPTPEEALLFCEGVQRSMALVAELPEDQRVALEMHRFGNYTLDEIAAHLGVSTATVHRLIRTALATITLGLDCE